MLPRRGSIGGRLTEDLPSTRLQGGDEAVPGLPPLRLVPDFQRIANLHTYRTCNFFVKTVQIQDAPPDMTFFLHPTVPGFLAV